MCDVATGAFALPPEATNNPWALTQSNLDACRATCTDCQLCFPDSPCSNFDGCNRRHDIKRRVDAENCECYTFSKPEWEVVRPGRTAMSEYLTLTLNVGGLNMSKPPLELVSTINRTSSLRNYRKMLQKRTSVGGYFNALDVGVLLQVHGNDELPMVNNYGTFVQAGVDAQVAVEKFKTVLEPFPYSRPVSAWFPPVPASISRIMLAVFSENTAVRTLCVPPPTVV
jgi:hypothetical protein